ncbi:PLP-dependent aminotransferase family protein [Acidisoma cladoniae]|jgi:DNA-binding transcriptional MocR family regulator|uniref:aminotransferase-like domain-containing protein n=1 Tax=Acidisoma cladoniae TaxID=3040935 RepID=UPI00254A21AC|nr:PLP-dependent aminotransferase family protein [Acidisoma sp. PAMC 29798]
MAARRTTSADPSPRWLPNLSGRTGPIYRELAAAIADAVRDGHLLPGDRLPTHRSVAGHLGVDLATVTRGYAAAHRQGLLTATVGRGTFVRTDAPQLRQRNRTHPLIDMTMNLPPLPADPSLRVMLQEGLARMLRRQNLAALMTYHWDTGSAEDREAGAQWLARTMGRVDPQRLLICPGAQSGMLVVLTSLARAGDVVATERFAYPGLRAMAAQLGITLVGVAMDEEGMLPEDLDRVCHESRPRLIVCTPTIQNPTTATMSVARRQAVVEIARAHAVPILEDDAYGLFPTACLPALATFGPDIVFHLATLAKTLSPGLRVAYLVVPSGTQVDRLTAALRGTVQTGSALLITLVTGWIRSGEAEALFLAIRREAVVRQALAASILTEEQAQAHPEGLHLWLPLPPHWDSAEFAAYARRQGLALVPESAFTVEGAQPGLGHVRIALGAAEDRDALATALNAVAGAIRRPVPQIYADIV